MIGTAPLAMAPHRNPKHNAVAADESLPRMFKPLSPRLPGQNGLTLLCILNHKNGGCKNEGHTVLLRLDETVLGKGGGVHKKRSKQQHGKAHTHSLTATHS